MAHHFTLTNHPKPQAVSKYLGSENLHGLVSPQTIVNEMRTLPSGPKILPALLELLASDESGIDSVVKLIRLERSLMARVLKMSNAVHHGGRGTCSNIEEAVGRLGFKQVQLVVINAIGAELLGKKLPAYGISGPALWRESVTVALAAETLANLTGANASTCYSLGLLHDVGKVVIDSWVQRQNLQLSFPSAGFTADTTAAETDALGFMHAEAGAAMLKKWNYPFDLCEPIRWQYEPELSTSYAKTASILFLARWVRDVVTRQDFIPLPPTLSDRYLGLGKSQLLPVIDHVNERLRNTAQLLSVV